MWRVQPAPVQDLIKPNLSPLNEPFVQEFAGMTTIPVTVEDLAAGRAYVPFCGHAVVSELLGSDITAPDPLALRFTRQQPNARLQGFYRTLIDEMADYLRG